MIYPYKNSLITEHNPTNQRMGVKPCYKKYEE